MRSNINKTALIVFSLSAEKEIHRKNIFGKRHHKENSAFFRQLILQTKHLADKSGVEVFWVDETKQQGSNFASRFANAFQELFDLGYQNVLSIGNDCPELTIEILQDAITQLQSKKLVVGPAWDGGIYLLGLNRAIFDQEQFLNLPWQSSSLYSNIIEQAALGSVLFHKLETLNDLDSGQDVCVFAKEYKFTYLGKFIRLLKSLLNKVFPTLDNIFLSKLRYIPLNLRAPPQIYSLLIKS
ncbi:DUF2064 domain-containing protein [Salegentibacter sp. JZCK2]|uniref:TIGR04282 family arsenosugar biosynthesis glycosyltransferase n=1 Tax=Salegentibacter tibetensis TaxID=2873600 RepID=UPI001CCA73A1|nr:DUF2064 domain-containing protein [Salegentibacter tibetensis]MBZ9730873.1 DUF2064 domain-containing protein [Salegentibacter tibetensis]